MPTETIKIFNNVQLAKNGSQLCGTPIYLGKTHGSSKFAFDLSASGRGKVHLRPFISTGPSDTYYKSKLATCIIMNHYGGGANASQERYNNASWPLTEFVKFKLIEANASHMTVSGHLIIAR